MERISRSLEASVANVAHEGDRPEECKDIGTSSPRKYELISNNARPSSFVSFSVKIADAGSENERSTDCLSHEPEAFTSHFAQTEAECGDSNEESLPHHIERWRKVNKTCYSKTVEALACDALLFEKCNTPGKLPYLRRCKDGKLAHFNCITDENTDSKMTPCTCLHPLHEGKVDTETLGLKGTLCRQWSYSKLLAESKSEPLDKFSVITSQTSDEEMEYGLPVSHKQQSTLTESPLTGNGNSLNEWKGKERVLDAGSRSVSEEDDSNENAESSNGKEPCSRGKRVWSCGQEICIECKRMRKSVDENTCSDSHVRESSFMNWVSSVTKGFFRSHHMESHSFGFIPNPVPSTQRSLFSGLLSNDSNNSTAPRMMGFGSIFKALYCPWLGKSMKATSPDYQGKCADFKELHSAKSVMDWIPHDNEAIELHKAVPISSMRNDQGVCQFRERPLAGRSISLRSSPIQEKMKHNMVKNYSLYNLGSSSLSFQNASCSGSDGAELSKLGTFKRNKSSDFSMERIDRVPENLWITRFLTKDPESVPCAIQRHHDRDMFLHDFRNDNASVGGRRNSVNVHLSSKDQGPSTSRPQHIDSVSPMMGSCYSKKVDVDNKVKSNLNPILPSSKFKNMEPLTSALAKRFDDLRQNRAPKADS